MKIAIARSGLGAVAGGIRLDRRQDGALTEGLRTLTPQKEKLLENAKHVFQQPKRL